MFSVARFSEGFSASQCFQLLTNLFGQFNQKIQPLAKNLAPTKSLHYYGRNFGPVATLPLLFCYFCSYTQYRMLLQKHEFSFSSKIVRCFDAYRYRYLYIADSEFLYFSATFGQNEYPVAVFSGRLEQNNGVHGYLVTLMILQAVKWHSCQCCQRLTTNKRFIQISRKFRPYTKSSFKR
jgi:hypothetical protein